jgi:hypothetical protein
MIRPKRVRNASFVLVLRRQTAPTLETVIAERVNESGLARQPIEKAQFGLGIGEPLLPGKGRVKVTS